MYSRQRNKSKKVPNVKLRPAQASTSSTGGKISRLQEQNGSFWAQDGDIPNSDDLTQAGLDSCPRPFKGIMVCATGISDKTTLYKQCLELGAMYNSDLTDRITHLVASEHGGAKYHCALERGLPILRPEWISDSYAIWLKGDDVDVAASIEEYRIPLFKDLIICVSGISDVQHRQRINKLVTHQSGSYVKALSRPVRVTHLLCGSDLDGDAVEAETDKMRYAQKFNERGEANIKIVWEEWFWDSIELGGRMKESDYLITKPRPERRSIPVIASSFVQEQTSSLPFQESLPQDTRDESDGEPEEIARVTRIPATTLNMWATLLKPHGYAINAGKLQRSPNKPSVPPVWGEPSIKAVPPLMRRDKDELAGGSVLATFNRARSFGDGGAPPVASTSRQPFRRIASAPNPNPFDQAASDIPVASSPASSADQVFVGRTFLLLGEAKCQNVRTEIEQCGGRVVSGEEESEEQVDFILVRLVSGSKLYLSEAAADPHTAAKYRTECWLERCIFEERICAADEHWSFLPLKMEVGGVVGAEDVYLSFSGLDQSEACWTRRLVRAIGANLAPTFSRRSTHLLCPSGTGVKADKAREWGIPIVDDDWVRTLIRTGELPGVRVVASKDKGKAREREDEAMLDITNHVRSHTPDDAFMMQESPLEAPDDQQNLADMDDDQFFGPPNPMLKLPSRSPRRSQTRSPFPPSHPPRLSLPPSTPAYRNSRPPPSSAVAPTPSPAIPSSNSPSPLRMPVDGTKTALSSPTRPKSNMSMSVSPSKMDERTRMLHASITNLLGKRTSEPEVTDGPARPHKRARAKPTSRKTSKESVTDNAQPTPPANAFESSLDAMGILGEDLPIEETLRITYEDPERKRLEKMLNVLPVDRPATGKLRERKPATRRSGRTQAA